MNTAPAGESTPTTMHPTAATAALPGQAGSAPTAEHESVLSPTNRTEPVPALWVDLPRMLNDFIDLYSRNPDEARKVNQTAREILARINAGK